MKNRTWAMVFVSAIAALLLVWKLLPAGSGQTAGVYQDGRQVFSASNSLFQNEHLREEFD